MGFADALRAVLGGARFTRKAWANASLWCGSEAFLSYNAKTLGLTTKLFIFNGKSIVDWIPTAEDLTAVDWIVVA